MKKTFKKFVSVALSVMLCATAVPASFVAANAATVTPKVAVGKEHTVVLKSDGTVWATGSNKYGQLGVSENDVTSGSDTDKTATFTQCVDENGKTIEDATDVACGRYHTAIIRSNGEVWQCGSNQYGQLGNTNVPSGSDSSRKEVFVKSYRSKTGNYLASPNSSNTEAITGATQIACGACYTAIICGDNNEIWQCGYNGKGQLGNISVRLGYNDYYSRVFVKSYKSNTGNYLESPTDSDIKAITGATQIICGEDHTVIICGDKKEVWQCGSNFCGQLGNTSLNTGNVANNYSTVFIKSYKSNTGNYLESPGSSNTEAITGATQIACGNIHTAIICGDNNEVWQCGRNNFGQLGNTSVPSDENSQVFVKSYKSNTGNYLASPSSGNTKAITGATQIACGEKHTAVIVNGEVWQCGLNQDAQLGNTSVPLGGYSEVFVKSSNITNAKELAKGTTGVYHTMALCTESDGTYALYGVGENGSGQLGLGAYNTPVKIFEKSPFKLEDNITALGKSKSRNVTGAGQFIGGYRLDVEWSNLQYTYTATWNVDEAKWDGAWTAADDNDKIVVKNGSATPCKVEFTFAANEDFKVPSNGQPGTKGTFADPKVTDEPALNTSTNSVPLAIYTTATPATSQKTVKLDLEGIPNAKAGTDIADATTVGTVTVTLKSADS